MPKTTYDSRERLQRREIPELPRPQPLHCVPAWLLSLLLHLCLIVIISLVWVAKPQGTAGQPDRPVGVAVVYETAGGEAYYVGDVSAQQSPSNVSAAADKALAASLPQSGIASVEARSILEDLLPQAGLSGGSPSDAAGGLGLDGGGAAVGENRSIPKVKTTVFGIEGEGTRFLYVFDRSDSMQGYGGAPLRSAKSELLKSIQSLGPLHQFQIIFYNDSPLPFGGMGSRGPQLFKGDEPSKLAALRFVRDVSAAGGTRHIEALRMALAMAPDVLFFLTDADSSPSASEIEDLQTRSVRSGTTIHAIQFGSGPNQSNESWISRLASSSGGRYRYLDVSVLGSP